MFRFTLNTENEALYDVSYSSKTVIALRVTIIIMIYEDI